jgi:predicted CopG family antitoxin
VHKTIGIDASVYERLKAAKAPGESFSDVIARLLAPRGSWRDLVGILGDDGEAMAMWLQEHRARQREDAKRWL